MDISIVRRVISVTALAAAMTLAGTGAAFAASVLPRGLTSYPGMSGTCTNCHTYASAPATSTPSAGGISAEKPYVAPGQSFVLSGSVSPSPDMIGRSVRVMVKKPGKTYWSYSSARIVYSDHGQAAWWYRYTIKPGMTRGTYLFKTLYVGSGFTGTGTGSVSVYVLSAASGDGGRD